MDLLVQRAKNNVYKTYTLISVNSNVFKAYIFVHANISDHNIWCAPAAVCTKIYLLMIIYNHIRSLYCYLLQLELAVQEAIDLKDDLGTVCQLHELKIFCAYF